MTKPSAGVAIKSLCVVVIRGGKKPLVVESACKIALALAEEAPEESITTPGVPDEKFIYVLDLPLM